LETLYSYSARYFGAKVSCPEGDFEATGSSLENDFETTVLCSG
jgi:hypothetical protein